MAFHDVQLPEDVEKGALGGPGFNTTVLELSSGFEKRNINWERVRGSWDVSYGLDKKSNQEAVLAFFYARQGRAHSWRFKDWTDYQIGDFANDLPQTIATADGVQTQFQIVRAYVSGSYTFNRAITRPTSPTTRVFLDGVEQFVDFTVDYDTGVITFTSAPADTVLVGVISEFDVPCRFNNDKLDMRAERDELYALPAIEVVEVREALQTLS